MDVTVVTVTYGQRLHLLTQVLDAARAQGAVAAVVVDNGSVDPVAEALAARYGAWAFVHGMGGNKGSAPGFKAGIEVALGRGAEYLLLLDDDNVVQPQCIDRLCVAYVETSKLIDDSILAVFAYRRDHQKGFVDRALNGRPLRTKSTFRGFHLLDIPRKIENRLSSGISTSTPVCRTVPTGWAPYGGLLFRRSLIGRIGLPNADFVLYEDDTEFTFRITKLGGQLLLVTEAEVIDADKSWNLAPGHSSTFSVWLGGGSDFRAFYAFRNGAFSDFYCRNGRWAAVFVNMLAYIAILISLAAVKRRPGRLGLLVRALVAGMRGKLGVAQEFPL